MPKVKIGVFDSGVGAIPVIQTIEKALPDLEIVYKDDHRHLPYGNRGIDEIHGFVRPIFKEFLDEGCQAVVIACNTVTTNLIKQLRKEFLVPMVGMEPALKPAAEATQTGIIAVCATPRTLQSKRYAELKKAYAKSIVVLEPDCSDWAVMIENNNIEREKVAETIEAVVSKGADQIVLGCTHYKWIEDLIIRIANNKIDIVQPMEPVLNQLKTELARIS